MTQQSLKNKFWWCFDFILITSLFTTIFLTFFPHPNPFKTLVWSDEFNSKSLDTSKWKIFLPGKHLDAQNNLESIKFDGQHINFYAITKNQIHYAAMICTEDLYEDTFKTWECRAKFDGASGTWADFWLYSRDVAFLENDLQKAGAEIDIFEHRLVDSENRDISNSVQHTVHWNGYGANHRVLSHNTGDLGLQAGWHTYKLERDRDSYSFFVDNKKQYKVFASITSKPLFIILSVEILNDGWAGKIPNEGYNQNILSVDWVRVYK